jgi:hypothetical protein
MSREAALSAAARERVGLESVHAERFTPVSCFLSKALHHMQLHRRQQFLGSAPRRDLFVKILEEVVSFSAG